MSSINTSEQQRDDNRSDVQASDMERGLRLPCGTDKPVLEDNLFLPSRQSQGLSTSFSQSAEIFQQLQQECMRRLNVPAPHLNSPSEIQTWDGHQDSVPPEDKPQIPPRVPLPPRPVKRGEYPAARWSRDLSPSPGDPTEDGSALDPPPQIPPREPLSQPGSRTPSPRGLVVGSPHQRIYSASPTGVQAPLSCYSSYLSTSPGKLMATTHSFASDPNYAAPKVIQAQGREAPSRGPCILPIVQDGRKVSSTHYYLLPERPPYLHRYDRFFREAENPPAGVGGEEKPGRQANTATVRPMLAQQAEPRANFSSNNNSGLGGPRSGMKTSVSLPRVCSDGPTGPEGGLSSADRVQLVRLQNSSINHAFLSPHLRAELLFLLVMHRLATRGQESHSSDVCVPFRWRPKVGTSRL